MAHQLFMINGCGIVIKIWLWHYCGILKERSLCLCLKYWHLCELITTLNCKLSGNTYYDSTSSFCIWYVRQTTTYAMSNFLTAQNHNDINHCWPNSNSAVWLTRHSQILRRLFHTLSISALPLHLNCAIWSLSPSNRPNTPCSHQWTQLQCNNSVDMDMALYIPWQLALANAWLSLFIMYVHELGHMHIRIQMYTRIAWNAWDTQRRRLTYAN